MSLTERGRYAGTTTEDGRAVFAGLTEAGVAVFGAAGGGGGGSSGSFTSQLGTVDSRLGNIVLGAPVGPVANDLAARVVLSLTARPGLTQSNELAARVVLDLDVTGSLGSPVNDLAARVVLSLNVGPALTQVHEMASRAVLELSISDSYTGPGTGLVVEGVTADRFMTQLEEGDTFHVLLPYAGLDGLSGLVRVLSRSFDEQGRLTFKLQVIPPTIDAAVMRSQADSGRPRLTIDKRSNLARRLAEIERGVNKLESTTETLVFSTGSN